MVCGIASIFFAKLYFFCIFFRTKQFLGVYMIKIRKNCLVSMQSRLILLQFAKHILHTLQPLEPLCMLKSASPMHRGCITDLLCKSVIFTKMRGGLSAWQMLYKSQSSTLSIAYDIGQFFLMYIYTPDGDLPYYIENLCIS